MPPEICPNCGAEIPPSAKACPECGSDEQTGWSDEARHDRLDLPDGNFNYEEFVKREFGGRKAIPHGLHWFWWVVGVIALVAFVWMWFR